MKERFEFAIGELLESLVNIGVVKQAQLNSTTHAFLQDTLKAKLKKSNLCIADVHTGTKID